MPVISPFDRPGRFYKGNLHTHCTRSDGAWPVEHVVRAYRDAGYDFVSLTDHFMAKYDFPVTDTRGFRDETFTTLLGAELHAPALDNGEVWHMVANGPPLDFPPPRDSETGPELAARAVEAGAFLALAHPLGTASRSTTPAACPRRMRSRSTITAAPSRPTAATAGTSSMRSQRRESA